VCELLAAAFDQPQPFDVIADAVGVLEEFGLGGFGWGVAWLDDDFVVRGRRGLRRFRDEARTDRQLREQLSRRFLVHLRRPSQLSTVQMADTQPFFGPEGGAFAHNGFLERAEEIRPQLASVLKGRADSEVGWRYFCARLAEGNDVTSALVAVDRTFGGKVNLGYLAPDGELTVFSHNVENHIWRFSMAGGHMATTALHSDDTSVFDLVYPQATDRQVVPPGSTAVVGPPLAERVGAGPASSAHGANTAGRRWAAEGERI
jgi:glutamine phosphoribosylpyrophosphate amidotransferase